MKKVKFTLSLLYIFILAVQNTFGIPDETVVAEFDGGEVIYKQIADRLSKVPPMYRSRYDSEKGKEELLDMLIAEELFYLESIKLEVTDDPRYLYRKSDQLKALFTKTFKEEFLQENAKISEGEKKAYFNENSHIYKDKKYEDVKNSITRKLKPEKDKEAIDNKKQELYEKYSVKIEKENIKAFNLENPQQTQDKEAVLIFSNNPEIEMTTAKLIEMFEYLPRRNIIAIKTNDDLETYLENRAEMDVFYQEAVENGFNDRQELQKEIEQAERNLLLRTAYNQLVVDQIDVSEEALRSYYNENIAQFSSKPYRKIQTFGFNDESTTRKMRKKVQEFIKKNDYAAIANLIAENSVYPAKNGILDYIYQNEIIPRIGKDKVYSEAVWEAEADSTTLCKVFKNSKDKYVFFRVLEDVAADPTPFAEVKQKIESRKMQNQSKEKFEEKRSELSDKYNLIKYPERLIVKLTVKEYFTKAEEAQKKRRFQDAIHYYDKVIDYYPNGTDDYKATFMKGFLFAEELNDNDKALELFKEFVEKFPKGDLHESAEYMIEDLTNEDETLPNFEE